MAAALDKLRNAIAFVDYGCQVRDLCKDISNMDAEGLLTADIRRGLVEAIAFQSGRTVEQVEAEVMRWRS